jgi:hypothetical protein
MKTIPAVHEFNSASLIVLTHGLGLLYYLCKTLAKRIFLGLDF